MPRSSRHKSKRNAKDAREYSDPQENVSKGKYREGKDEGGSRGYKEFVSGSGEKRKLASQSVVVKDSSGHGNDHSSDEYVSSKKRKGKSDNVGSDRWNGSGEILSLESENREESWRFDGKVLKSKGLIDLKSKVGIARGDVEKKEEDAGLILGKVEKCEKIESKRVYKVISEKEKLNTRENEIGSERDNWLADCKRDLDYHAVDSKEQKLKKGVEIKGWPLEGESRKQESEKDHDRRRKKRTSEPDDKDKYQNRNRDNSDLNLTSRHERDKDGRDRDERHRDISIRDKHYFASEEVYGKHESEKDREIRRRKRIDEADDKNRYPDRDRDSSDIRREQDKDERHKDISNRDKDHDYYDRDGKSRDVDKREGAYRDRTQKFDDFKDDRASRDIIVSKNDFKYVRDETEILDIGHKKSRTDSDRNVKYNDQGYRSRGSKETRGSMDEDFGDMRSRSGKDYLESEKKSAGVREESILDRERSHSFLPDESTLGQSRRKRSPSSSTHATRDQYRYPKQTETKYKESLPDERPHNNLHVGKEGNDSMVSERDHSSKAIDKSVLKGESAHIADLSSVSHRDRRTSPVRLTSKSQSPSSTERRHLSRTSDRRSLEYEESEDRNIRYKDKNYHYHDGKRMQEAKVEAPSKDGSPLVYGDNVPISSSFPRSARMHGNSRSHLPPPSPLTHGVDNSYFGSSEEDGRGKSNNRPKRPVDSNIRTQGNAWWGAPNWPSPMANGLLPFPLGSGAVGFHPMMQQFPPHMFGVRPPMDHSGVPFHVPDGDGFSGYGRPFGWPNPVDEACTSPMLNWDSNTVVPGEGYKQGKLDSDQHRSLISASREPSVDRYKGANSSTVESPSGSRRPTEEPIDDISSKSNHDLKNKPRQGGNHVDLAEAKRKNADTEIDDHVHCACAYLSKIDISACLAYSDLFDQCASLLRKKQTTLSDTRVSGFSLEEENGVEGGSTATNSYISCLPIFAGGSDSLLEKAMSLYRQHKDGLMSASIGNQVDPSPEIQGFESAPSLDEGELIAPLQLGKVTGQESPELLSEVLPASNVNGDKAMSPILSPKPEAPCSISNKDVAVKPVNTVPLSEEGKEEMLSRYMSEDNVDKSIMEGKKTIKNTCTDVDEARILNTATGSTCDADCPAEDDYCNKESEDEQAAVKTTATSISCESTTSNVPFELNEFGSCDLSRIHHHSSESTR